LLRARASERATRQLAFAASAGSTPDYTAWDDRDPSRYAARPQAPRALLHFVFPRPCGALREREAARPSRHSRASRAILTDVCRVCMPLLGLGAPGGWALLAHAPELLRRRSRALTPAPVLKRPCRAKVLCGTMVAGASASILGFFDPEALPPRRSPPQPRVSHPAPRRRSPRRVPRSPRPRCATATPWHSSPTASMASLPTPGARPPPLPRTNRTSLVPSPPY